MLGKNILRLAASTSTSTPFVGAGAYICGEETALLESLEGKQGKPRFKPPFPANFGLYGAPTTINNTQSFASVPTILRKGAAVVRGARRRRIRAAPRSSRCPGHVDKPGNFELPLGIPFAELLEIAGGVRKRPQAQGRDPRRLVGAGAAGREDDGRQHGLRLAARRRARASVPARSIVMDETTCMVQVLERLARFYYVGVLRPVHAVPRRHRLDVPRAHADHGGQGRQEDLRAAASTSPNRSKATPSARSATPPRGRCRAS